MKFNSIKFRFVIIYASLVLFVLVSVAAFIVTGLETELMKGLKDDIKKQVETMTSTSRYFTKENWSDEDTITHIQTVIDENRFNADELVYVISNDSYPSVIAGNDEGTRLIVGKNAYDVDTINQAMLLEALKGNLSEKIIGEGIDAEVHLSYPVVSEKGKVKGVVYVISSTRMVEATVKKARQLLTVISLAAIFVTILIAYLLASSIVSPISSLTQKAKRLAEGDFTQKVEVRSKDEIGKLASMFNTLTNELNKTISEKDLEQKKLETIFTNMTEAIIALNSEGELIHANSVAQKLIDIDIKRDTQRYFNLDKIGLSSINFDNPFTLEGEEEIELKGGVYKMTYAPFENEDYSLGGIIIMFQDITKEHRLDNMRKEFVANVSHELKTPITAIRSYSETLLEGGVPEEMQNKFLGVIEKEADRMNRLVLDLLLLSNIDYKGGEDVKVTVLNDKVKDAIDKLKILADEKKQKLIYSIAGEPLKALIDPDSFEQIITNLISNAIKYTNEEGTIEVKLYSVLGKIHIDVIDNGIGIPEKDQKRIFERFYRVEKGRSRKMGGTGLGLSIAKEMANAYKADIVLTSKFGIGTTFTFLIDEYKETNS